MLFPGCSVFGFVSVLLSVTLCVCRVRRRNPVFVEFSILKNKMAYIPPFLFAVRVSLSRFSVSRRRGCQLTTAAVDRERCAARAAARERYDLDFHFALGCGAALLGARERPVARALQELPFSEHTQGAKFIMKNG